MRKTIAWAIALGSCLWGGIAFSQDSTAAAPAATTGASASTSGDDTIHLHMPVHRRAAHAARKPDENAVPRENPSVGAIGADTESLPTVTPPAAAPADAVSPQTGSPAKAAKSARAPGGKTKPAIPFTFGEDSGMTPQAAGAPPGKTAIVPARETKTASLPPKPQPPKESSLSAKLSPVRTAKGEHAGLTKRGAIMFDKGVSNPSPAQFDGVKLLAGDVSTALEGSASRVQLEAFGGAPGDKSSDARRLSLKRALAVRQLLIDNGVPSNRIDVRAMGGADDKGPNDRVDVYVRAS